MPASPHVVVEIDRDRLLRNVQSVRARVGRAEVYAVVKADAYGLGAAVVANVIRERIDGFVVFEPAEAAAAGLRALGKPILALRCATGEECAGYGLRPAVWDVERARALRRFDPLLCVDTGMQRFACPPERVDRVLEAGGIREAYTHATRVEHVARLVQLVGNRGLRLHAAGSALLDEPEAHLDLVRPGLALYRGAVSARTRCIEVRDSRGPVGYTGFSARRHGVIPCGYSNGLRRGPCLVDGQRRSIPEVGMQSAFVELEPGDEGAEVVLLGHSRHTGTTLSEDDVASAWGCTPQEALVHLSRIGRHEYVGEAGAG